ncbi:hypothetical protein FV767_04885 [Vibrio parahaemolyticus]|nr:hypothetical protein [Vibrio parahaemolyticus]
MIPILLIKRNGRFWRVSNRIDKNASLRRLAF